MNIQQCKEQIKLLQEQIKTLEVKFVFPILGKTTRVLIANGDILGLCDSIVQEAEQGNTFYTEKTALKERNRRAARARILEAIHLINKDDVVFESGEANFYFEYNYIDNHLDYDYLCSAQHLPHQLYLRDEKAVLDLLNNKQFVQDYEIYLGVK